MQLGRVWGILREKMGVYGDLIPFRQFQNIAAGSPMDRVHVVGLPILFRAVLGNHDVLLAEDVPLLK